MTTSGSDKFPARLGWLLAVLTLVWGVNWPVMKIVMSEMAPMHFRLVCLVGAAAGLFLIARAGGLPVRVPAGSWLPVMTVGIIYMAGWNIGAAYGVKLMASGRAATLGYTMPAWGAMLTAWLLDERFSLRRVVGVSLAMAGVALLLGSEYQALGRSPVGALCMLGAAFSWALATVLMKRWPVDLPLTSLVAWQMVFGAIPILAAAILFESGSYNPFALSLWPMLGLLYNILISFIFGYWAWTKIVVGTPVAVSTLAIMMTPVVGVFSGMLVLGERPQWQDYVALACVLLSLCTVLIPSNRAKRPGSVSEMATRMEGTS